MVTRTINGEGQEAVSEAITALPAKTLKQTNKNMHYIPEGKTGECHTGGTKGW